MSRTQDFQLIYKRLCNELSQSDDVACKDISRSGTTVRLLYIKSISDEKVVIKDLFKTFWKFDSPSEYAQYLSTFPNCIPHRDVSSTLDKILQGYVAVALPKGIYLFPARNDEHSPVEQTGDETVVLGPKDSFNESIATNLNLIRTRYQAEALRIESQKIGRLSKTKIAVIYDNQLVDRAALQELQARLLQIETELLQSAGDLQNLLVSKKMSLLPTIILTERPDRSVLNLAKGRILIVIDKSPFVAIIPSTFPEFLSSMDDKYQLPVVGKFLLTLRFIGFFLAISTPALYIATVSYNPEVFRVQLAFSIASSRAAVPYPSILEVLFMLLMTEFLVEASVRLPRAIGQTATTVGGLILGQAATAAGLVSNIMIIIVSVVALSNFVIPINEMTFAVRTLKYFMVFITAIFGLVGFTVGLVALIFYIASIESFGMPYIKLFRKDSRMNGN